MVTVKLERGATSAKDSFKDRTWTTGKGYIKKNQTVILNGKGRQHSYGGFQG